MMKYRRRSVLIAHGNRTVAQECRQRLEQSGFSVFVASDGDQACILAARQRFDLIVSNLDLPLVSGIEFCRHVREDLHLVDVPIAVCGSTGRNGDVADFAIDYSITRVFDQPLDANCLVEFAKETTSALVTA